MNKNSHVFFSYKDGKLIKSYEEVANYVLIPMHEYEEYITDEELLTSPELKLINIHEFYGGQNAIRIVRNRALQQVDKERADNHGYTLKFCERKRVEKGCDETAFFITKETPYSLKISLEDATALIQRDLQEFYHYVVFPEFEYAENNNAKRKLTKKEIIQATEQMKYEEYSDLIYLLENSIWGRNVRKFYEKTGIKKCIFDIEKFGLNYGIGRYQVSYWATHAI